MRRKSCLGAQISEHITLRRRSLALLQNLELTSAEVVIRFWDTFSNFGAGLGVCCPGAQV
jgi:hypothetical protein